MVVLHCFVVTAFYNTSDDDGVVVFLLFFSGRAPAGHVLFSQLYSLTILDSPIVRIHSTLLIRLLLLLLSYFINIHTNSGGGCMFCSKRGKCIIFGHRIHYTFKLFKQDQIPKQKKNLQSLY